MLRDFSYAPRLSDILIVKEILVEVLVWSFAEVRVFFETIVLHREVERRRTEAEMRKIGGYFDLF